MPIQISSYARGLLDLLGLKNYGENPRLLADLVSPTIDLTTLYLSNATSFAFGLVAAPAAGQNIAITVPLGEVWLVDSGGFFFQTGAGVTADWTPIAIIDGGVVPLGSTVVQIANQTRMATPQAWKFWLKAGQSLGVYITNLVGVPTISGAFNMAKLRA